MKAFRGTLLAGTVVGVLGISIWMLAPEVISMGTDEPVPLEQSKLVHFEPHELVSVRVERPDGDVITLLQAEDGTWGIEGTEFVASRSMVNRVKHQFHQLTPRSVVTEAVEDPELYGLGSRAVRVTMTLRDGQEIALLAGDPNPSSVSYYVQPLPGNTVYTVQKAAVDYLSMDRSRFRENRFVSFDGDEVNRLEIDSDIEGVPESLVFIRTGERSWRMESPLQQDAGDEHIRRLLGRASALKAKSFIEETEQSEAHGMDQPRSTWRLQFASGESLDIEIGAPADEQNLKENLYYIRLNGQGTVFLAKAGLLEELEREPEKYRNREVVKVSTAEVIGIRATLRSEEDQALSGQQEVRFAAEQWLWADGVPVSGSTPKRVATAVSGVEASEFMDDSPESLEPFGLDDPVARIWLETGSGVTIEVLIGDLGEPETGLEGHMTPRRYLMVAGQEPVYLVDEKVLKVTHDLIREGNRKDANDQDRNISRDRTP